MSLSVTITYKVKKMFDDGSCQPGIDFKLHETKEGHNDNHYNYYFILAHITIVLVL